MNQQNTQSNTTSFLLDSEQPHPSKIQLLKRRDPAAYDRCINKMFSILEQSNHNDNKALRLFYISSSSNSKSQLSDKILTDGIKNGGRVADLSMKFLVERHIGYVKKEAAKSFGLPYDEAVNRGIQGLWTAAMKYDENRGASFLTYARQWVHRNTQNRGTVADTSLPQMPENSTPIDCKNRIKSFEMAHDVELAVSKLRIELKDVIYQKFYRGATVNEMVETLGVSRQTVINRVKEACAILKEELRDYGKEVANV